MEQILIGIGRDAHLGKQGEDGSQVRGTASQPKHLLDVVVGVCDTDPRNADRPSYEAMGIHRVKFGHRSLHMGPPPMNDTPRTIHLSMVQSRDRTLRKPPPS